GLKAFGAFSTSAGQLAIANSLGVFHHQHSTQAIVNSVVMGDAGSGYADRGAIDVSELDKNELASEVIDKAQRNQNARPVEPGYYMQDATRAGRQSTGHGLPAPNTEGPFAVNLFMQPGTTAKAELVSDIKRGIWVTRFWYVRIVHPKASIITGMTREGTFLIEDGKITRPVKDLRFTQSILEALSGTLALSRTTKLEESEYFGATRVPAVHLKAFTFTS